MEPFSIHPGGCSCSGCVYRSRSKESSVQQLLQEGSDIDKLYFGKFLPLRERKLLERLIRTRDVYDGVRNQLLSSASEQTIPKHKKKRRDEDLSSEQSSAVLNMVDLVDRGLIGSATERKKVRGRHKKQHKEHRHIGSVSAGKATLGSCCSCCSCETLRKIRKQMEREDKKYPKVHRQIVTCEDIAKYCEEAAKKGRKRRRKLSTKFSKLSSKVGSARFKIKRNLSEPTVMIKSRALMKRIRSKMKVTDSSTEIVTRDQETKTAKGQRRKVKKNQSYSAEDSATVLGTLAAKIIKDSLILFKEKLLKKRPYDKNKHVECEPGTCEEGTCSPEECFKKLKSKRVGDTGRRKHHHRHSETGRHKSYISMKIRPKKVKGRESQVKIAKTKSSSSLTISKTDLKGINAVFPKPAKGKHGKTLSKSAASMTSLPKLKAKAQLATEEETVAPKLKTKANRRPVARDKYLEENVPVEVLHKSKAKTITATKSISSSLTSVAKEKATKARSKSIKTLERHEGEPASPPKRYKTGRQKPRRELLQDMEETDIQESIVHLKAKKEKRIKPTHGRKQRQKYKHSKTHFAGASPKASKHSRDSASRSSKPHRRNALSKSKGISVESAAFSQKTSSGSRTKSKQQQSKSALSFPKKSKNISKELPPEIEIENYIECYPNRQAVKISSSFSFNIEFYKEAYPCVEVSEQPDFEPPQTPRPRRRIKQKQHRRKFKDQATGHIRSRHYMSSQSGSTTQSFKSTQVAHKLKRCFCTQKLIQTKKQKLNYLESKKTMASLDTNREVTARQIRTQTKHSGMAYVVPASTSTQGEFNRRAGKHVSRDTNTTDTQGIVQSPKVSSDRWDGTGQRQAVQIGSNFNFSVEFSKTNINNRVTANAMICDRPIQMERRQTRPKRIKVYKPSVCHEISETTRIHVKTKQTEPFLQRCLCTLKLLKKNKKKVENLSPWRNRDEYVMHMQNGAENRYNNPYDCEPGSCIPREYHPYDCEKLIRLRQIKLKQKYSNKCVLGSRSTFSNTSESTTSSNSQTTQFFTRESRQKGNKINQHYNEINFTRDRFKQRVMRGGSNLSSKIEFSKEKSAHYKRKDNFITTEDCINNHTQNKYKSNTKDSQQVEHPAYHTSIDTKPKLEKGSSVVSVIKKCFSILKFPRKTNKLELQNKNNVISESEKTSHPLPSSQISEYKNTRARSRKLFDDLSSHERSPNFLISRLDKPYANMNRPNRKSVKSVTSGFIGSTKATQSRLLKQRGMKAALSFSPSRLAVCKASKFSFNKKKSTNRYIPSIRNTTIKNRVEKYNTVSDISKINRIKDQLCPSQENNFRKEHKASDVALFLKKCFCRLGLQKKNLPEREFHWQQPITTQFVQVEHNNKKNNRHNVTKSGCNVVTKTLNAKERLLSKLSEGRFVFKENLFQRQNVIKTSRCNGSQNLPNSSFTRRAHIRSQIDVNFDKIKKILSIQKINPFYQSFYSLNIKVSKSNVKSYGSFDSKAGKKLGDCAAGRRDAEDCIQRVSRLKRMKQILAPDPPCKDMLDMSKFDCYEKCKREFEGKKVKPGPFKPLILGSDFKIRAGVYTDTNPYKDSHRQAVRIGSDVRVDVDFFREPTRRNICLTGPIHAGPIPKDRMMMGSIYSFGRNSRQVEDTTPNDERRLKPSRIKLMMKRLSIGSAKLKRSARSDINQKRDEIRIYRDRRKRKSTLRLPYRRESSKSGYVQFKECAPQQQKQLASVSKSTYRNNVTFSTNVNCLEYDKERRRKGEGDVGKQYGSKTVMDCLCRLKTKKDKCMSETKTEAKSPTICTCRAKSKAKHICRQLEEAEREMKIIMPYSKKKFKKLERQSKLPPGTDEQNVCAPKCRSVTKEAKEAKKVVKAKTTDKDKDIEKQKTLKNPVRVTPSFECLYNQKARLRRLCPVCRDKAKGKFRKGKNKLKCMCMDEEIVPEKPKDLSKCPCFWKNQFSIKDGDGAVVASAVVVEKLVDNSPRFKFKMTRNKEAKKANKVAKAKAKDGKEKQKMQKCSEYDVRVTTSFKCLCNQETRDRHQCPVCRDKAEGKFRKGKSKLKCTCMDEEIVPEKPKDLSKCPCFWKNPFSIKDGHGTVVASAVVVEKPVANSPRFKFKMTRNKEAKKVAKAQAKNGKEKQKMQKCSEYNVRVTSSFECLCNQETRHRPQCPVCRDKAEVKFRKGKNKLKCTCMDEEIVPEKPKDLSKCRICKEESVNKTILKVPKCPCCWKKIFSIKDCPGAAVVRKPVDNSLRFEMTLNTTNMKVLNKEEVLKEMSKSSKEAADRQEKVLKQAKGHGCKCKCCVCRSLKKSKPLALIPSAVKKPCVCGSVVCKKDWDRIKQDQAALAIMKSKLRKCVCGSAICKAESSKRSDELLEEARQALQVKKFKKQARLREKAYQKARLRRRKMYEKERKKQDKLRKKQDKADMKSIKMNPNPGDVSMVAESLIDLGNFGSKAFCDVATTIFRGVLHPRDAITDIRKASSDPAAAAKRFRRNVERTGIFPTIKRIKARFLKMPATIRAVKVLESHPPTNYLIHMADKDPKKRMKKFKTSKPSREPVEFECSPYMSSLRKRPCLRVYYMCPWFYPHCINLLGLWKQLQDILLFILAVAVWSPCIMCIELCRGFVCCVMCQG